MRLSIRQASPADAAALLAIYAPYVERTAVSFEEEVPSVEEFARRIANISAMYPFLTAETGGNPVGYAYAARYRERIAYRYDVETSIYLAEEFHGSGVAQRLYAVLFDLLRVQGFYNAYAMMCMPHPKSERFHEKQGFTRVGVFRNTGYKFGRWHSILAMEKNLRACEDEPPGEIIPVGDLPEGFVQKNCLSYSLE